MKIIRHEKDHEWNVGRLWKTPEEPGATGRYGGPTGPTVAPAGAPFSVPPPSGSFLHCLRGVILALG